MKDKIAGAFTERFLPMFTPGVITGLIIHYRQDLLSAVVLSFLYTVGESIFMFISAKNDQSFLHYFVNDPPHTRKLKFWELQKFKVSGENQSSFRLFRAEASGKKIWQNSPRNLFLLFTTVWYLFFLVSHHIPDTFFYFLDVFRTLSESFFVTYLVVSLLLIAGLILLIPVFLFTLFIQFGFLFYYQEQSFFSKESDFADDILLEHISDGELEEEVKRLYNITNLDLFFSAFRKNPTDFEYFEELQQDLLANSEKSQGFYQRVVFGQINERRQAQLVAIDVRTMQAERFLFFRYLVKRYPYLQEIRQELKAQRRDSEPQSEVDLSRQHDENQKKLNERYRLQRQ